MSKVSIIMPSYNVVDYISECLESVISQTLQDVEILCVDAGSEDGTLEIIKKYMDLDDRIRLIISKQKSYGYQVNLGIREATGEYIGIVETDDYIDREMYEKLYITAKEYKLDCIKGDHYIFTGQKGSYKYYRRDALFAENSGLYEKLLRKDDYKEKFSAYLYTWSGIYLRQFLLDNSIFHNESPGASYQDNGFWFQTMIHSERLMYINQALYYLRRDNPNSSFFNSQKAHCLKKEYDFIHDKITDGGFDTYTKHFLYEICFKFRLYNYIGYAEKTDDESYSDLYRMMREDIITAKKNDEISLLDIDNRASIFISEVLNCERPIRIDDMVLLNWHNYELLRNCSGIYIYGSGKIGKKVFNILKQGGLFPKVKGFINTEIEGNQKEECGLPVFGIRGLEIEQNILIVAVGEKFKNDVFETLNMLRYKYYYYRDFWLAL